MSIANLLSSFVFKVPYFGNQYRISKLHVALVEIERVKKQFGKPMVRFDDNIHALYDCLQGVDLVLQEDISWFSTFDISCYSKTSIEASRYLQGQFSNEFPKEEHFFKNTSVNSLRTEFMGWYANYGTAQDFVDKFFYLLFLYILENPKTPKHANPDMDEQDDVGGTISYYDPRKIELNSSILELFKTQPFRLLLDDFLVLAEVVIVSQLRRLNGEQSDS